MKKEICKFCKKEYNIEQLKRSLGDQSPVIDFNCCSA